MTTVIFVHGTSVRSEAYSHSVGQIQKGLREASVSARSHRQLDLTVEGCYWGGLFGAKLNLKGASVPQYDSTRGFANVRKEDIEITLWSLLYQDPLYELRLLSLHESKSTGFVAGKAASWKVFDSAIRRFTKSQELEEKLKQAGIDSLFDETRKAVINSKPYREAIRNAPPSEYRAAVARAVVAEAIARAAQQEQPATILTDAMLRDEMVQHLIEEWGGTDRSIGGWVAKQLLGLALKLGALNPLQHRRGWMTDVSYPSIGDVLLYQGRGEQIRALIRQKIEQATSPVVLLAHSLGGISCVDLLVKKPEPKVKLLVTVGSQAPFLYEINALHSLPYGEPLPVYFPPWLNIYDLRDYLSYIGAKVFPGRVEDVLVDNRQPFPQSHSAYWANPVVWDEIVKRLP